MVVVMERVIMVINKIDRSQIYYHSASNAFNSKLLIYFCPNETRNLELMLSLLKVSP